MSFAFTKVKSIFCKLIASHCKADNPSTSGMIVLYDLSINENPFDDEKDKDLESASLVFPPSRLMLKLLFDSISKVTESFLAFMILILDTLD